MRALQAYSGRWYEIARLPLFWEDDCDQAIADYRVSAQGLIVVNSCLRHGRVVRQERGIAREYVSPYGSKEFPMTFRLIFEGYPNVSDYWIEDTNFTEYSIVGGPSRKYLWLLSRTPSISNSRFEYFLERSEEMGYDLSELQLTGKIRPD